MCEASTKGRTQQGRRFSENSRFAFDLIACNEAKWHPFREAKCLGTRLPFFFRSSFLLLFQNPIRREEETRNKSKEKKGRLYNPEQQCR